MRDQARSLRPDPATFHPYYSRYTQQVPDGDIVATLARQAEVAYSFFASITPAASLRRYAPGKWSIREVVIHINDTERVLAYRLLRFARGDRTPLAGFQQDDWIPAARADERPWEDLVAEFHAVRQATLALVASLDDAAWDGTGQADGKPLTVRALAWILAGHAEHHLRIIRERYLGGGMIPEEDP